MLISFLDKVVFDMECRLVSFSFDISVVALL